MRQRETVELSDGRKVEVEDCTLGQFREISKALSNLRPGPNGELGKAIEDVMAEVIQIVGLVVTEKTPMTDVALLYRAIMRVSNILSIMTGGAEAPEAAEKKA